MNQEELGVVVFRLNALDTTVEEVNKKLDRLLVHQQEHMTNVALVKQSQLQAEKRMVALETKLEQTQEQTSDLRVGLAEKLGPGAIAGALTAGLMTLIRFLLGA